VEGGYGLDKCKDKSDDDRDKEVVQVRDTGQRSSTSWRY